MSRYTVDPQIQQLRAMRLGDIAFSGETVVVALSTLAAPSPYADKALSPATVDTRETLAGSPSETPAVGVAFTRIVSANAPPENVSISAVDTRETLAGNPSESPTVGVGTGTSVV